VQRKLGSILYRKGRGALSILGREALRIVLPSWCACCDRELPWRERTASCCTRCWATLPRIEVATCASCSQPAPVRDADEYLCLACHVDPLPVEWCLAWGEYRGGLERLLHALKFQRHDFLDEALSALLEEVIRARGDLLFDAIVPVPMPPARERRRGYNQAELLARALSRRVGIACEMEVLTRAADGATQSTLPKRQRAANVRHAFSAAPAAGGRSILLVDDISTTGETLRACALALQDAGASRICAAVVAKAT
jgi:competence protein ComFC